MCVIHALGHPLTDSFGVLEQTTQLSYSDAGQDWKYENSNYMRNKFKVDNKQYERHEAAMAKKVSQMKSEK